MKAINITKIFSAIILIFTAMSACENDGDKITLSGLEGSDLIATEENVVLSQDKANQLVLSLAWTSNTLTINNPGMSAPDILTTYIQISAKSDFTSDVTESIESSYSKAYTGSELNAAAKSIGAEADISSVFYFRLKASVSNNIEPVYSNIVTVNITPYLIDMSVGYILDSKMEDSGITLYSPESNGIYTGFMGASSWYNFYLREGEGTIWGNEGVSGTPFVLSSEDDSDKRWNCWFPGITGCYYTEVNTVRKQWSALLIPTLTVSGDINAEMIFDRPNVKWTTVFTSTGSATLKLKFQGTGKQYNVTSGTDDTSATDAQIAFTGSGDNLIFGTQAGEISVTVPDAGEYTLVVDLSNPRAWKCEAVSGTTDPIEINPYLYLPGIDDGTSGSWTFDNALSLYNEDELSYAGVVNVNSLWGYGIYTEKDNWDNAYKLGEGNAYEGTLVLNGEDNIPAPDAGLYLIDVSLKDLTYNMTAITDKIYAVGLHDKWEFDIPLEKNRDYRCIFRESIHKQRFSVGIPNTSGQQLESLFRRV